MQLSIIIVTYNSENDIYDCIKSIYQYNDIPQKDIEIIVVDNQSQQYGSMRKRLSDLYPSVKVVLNPRNGGYGQGNNMGIKMATAQNIAIMNPDVRLTMPIFAEMLSCLQKKDVALCAGKQFDKNGEVFSSFFSTFTTPWWIGRPLEYFTRRKWDKYLYKIQYLSGAFFFVKRYVMESIGLFDENIFMYAEENDIHYRIRHKFPHMKMIYLNHLHYAHLANNRPFDTNHVRQVYLSNGYFFTKNGMSPKRYWKQQIILNWFLSHFYQLRSMLHHHQYLDTYHTNERNKILKELIKEL